MVGVADVAGTSGVIDDTVYLITDEFRRRFLRYVSPNSITLAGLLVHTLLIFLLCWQNQTRFGPMNIAKKKSAILIFCMSVLMHTLIDSMDGRHAREFDMKSPLGGFLDHSTDTTVFIAWQVCLGLNFNTLATFRFNEILHFTSYFAPLALMWALQITGKFQDHFIIMDTRFTNMDLVTFIAILGIGLSVFGSEAMLDASAYILLWFSPLFVLGGLFVNFSFADADWSLRNISLLVQLISGCILRALMTPGVRKNVQTNWVECILLFMSLMNSSNLINLAIINKEIRLEVNLLNFVILGYLISKRYVNYEKQNKNVQYAVIAIGAVSCFPQLQTIMALYKLGLPK